MSLSRKIVAAVAEWAGAGAGPTSAVAEDGPHRLALSLRQASPVGVEADGLEFAVSGRPEWSVEQLRAWGDRLAARLTYLMEPLAVIEVDPQGVEVELRSKAPTARAGRRTYYEARLDRRGTARLVRVAYDEVARRRQTVPFQLTSEVLERLADDLVASVA